MWVVLLGNQCSVSYSGKGVLMEEHGFEKSMSYFKMLTYSLHATQAANDFHGIPSELKAVLADMKVSEVNYGVTEAAMEWGLGSLHSL